MSDIAISVSNVSKCYRVFDDQRSRLLHTVWPTHNKGMQEVWALKDINFEIKRGESVAIIGRNGGGKSTLLEILTGTLTPTTGSVKVNGRVSALLELGSGFNPEYSGRDNVILNGLLLGLSKEDILNRFGDIESFAEIGAAIDRPVKTYSSGMMMRLAFAVQVLCDPDILIIDEALSVGDFFFQQKCLRLLKNFSQRGVTLLFVSHDMQTVREICRKGLYLNKGRCEYWGGNLEAIGYYLNGDKTGHISDAGDQAISTNTSEPAQYWSNAKPKGEQYILSVNVCSPDGNRVSSVKIGEYVDIYIRYRDKSTNPCHVTCTLKNRFDQIVTTFGTYTSGVQITSISTDERLLKISACLLLEAGEYSIQVEMGTDANGSTATCAFRTPWLGPIRISWDYANEIPPFYGLVGLPVHIDLR